MSLFVVAATTTGPFSILPVNADPDEKSKAWESEDQEAIEFNCEKVNDECKGIQINKDARDLCNDFSDSKCKKAHN